MTDTKFLLITSKPINFKVFERFSELCDYINDNKLNKINYRVLLDNLQEITPLEYKYISNETFK